MSDIPDGSGNKDIVQVESAILSIQERQLHQAKTLNRWMKFQFWSVTVASVIMAAMTGLYININRLINNNTELLRISSADQIRPYVFPSTISRNGQEFVVDVKNVGQTPAYKVIFNGEIFIRKADSSGIIDVGTEFASDCSENLDGGGKSLPFNLGANDVQTKYPQAIRAPELSDTPATIIPKFISKFDDGDLQSVASGQALYVLVGIVCYRNLRGEPHYTRYCRFFGTPKGAGIMSGTKNADTFMREGVNCPSHNDAD